MKFNLHGVVSMSDVERNEFSQEIANFVTAFAAEVRDLRKTIGISSKTPSTNRKTPSGDAPKEEVSHKEDISTFLLEVCPFFYCPLHHFIHTHTQSDDINPQCNNRSRSRSK